MMLARVDKVDYLNDIATRVAEFEKGSLHVDMVDRLYAGAVPGDVVRIARQEILQRPERFIVVFSVKSKVPHRTWHFHGILFLAKRQQRRHGIGVFVQLEDRIAYGKHRHSISVRTCSMC